MFNAMRRKERRDDIIEFLRGFYPNCANLCSAETGKFELTHKFHDEPTTSPPFAASTPTAAVTAATEVATTEPPTTAEFLEAGSLVLDRENKVAFCALSKRCSAKLAEEWAKEMGYQLVAFNTKAYIHHTDLMMSIGSNFAVVCSDNVASEEAVAKMKDHLAKTKKVVIDISVDQMQNFCGNVLELVGTNGQQVVLVSTTAYNSFTQEQLEKLKSTVTHLVHVNISTLESVGGGCISGLFNRLF
eukprot:TRINITY_DN10135_c0_g1_i1.p1 TRINITY_DN10135_c0_g1~~TRINITY_DN10135_c0_g1_i1.p1  ORF type:complete len:265 (+),score=103.53 TRINITY_DN10135_c0_g1_i1:64-795(+)